MQCAATVLYELFPLQFWEVVLRTFQTFWPTLMRKLQESLPPVRRPLSVEGVQEVCLEKCLQLRDSDISSLQ